MQPLNPRIRATRPTKLLLMHNVGETMADDYLSQGIAAVKAGQKQEARRLLDAAIRAAPDDIRTWSWFYDVCLNNTERIKCLKQILRINPNLEQSPPLVSLVIISFN